MLVFLFFSVATRGCTTNSTIVRDHMKKLRKRNASTCFAQRLLTDWNTFPCWLDKKGARLSCSIMLCSLSPCTHRGTSRSRSWNTERHIGMAQHYSTCYSTTACYPPQTVICGGRWEAYDDGKHIHTLLEGESSILSENSMLTLSHFIPLASPLFRLLFGDCCRVQILSLSLSFDVCAVSVTECYWIFLL